MADLLENEYRLLKLLGSGFSGLVYLAEQLDSGEMVAIKEFPAGREATSHFLRELSTLFTLQHPNLVSCKNLIYGGHKKSYLIMEYANGGSLRNRLERDGVFSEGEARRILIELLRGLSHLHESGIVHCDLKPENILLFDEEAGRTVFKITDLGIARFRASEESISTPGSALYMAPEQFYDKATEFSDIYSLGVVFFEMLTGNFLFEGEPDQLFASHVNNDPDFSDVKCELCQTLLSKMLAKAPADRPSSAHATLALIEMLWDSSENLPAVSTEDLASREPEGTFSFERTREVPGARRLLGGSQQEVMLSRHMGTDLYNPDTDVLQPLFFSDVLSCQNNFSDSQKLISGKRWIYRVEDKNKLRPLFQTGISVKSLSGPDKKGRIVYADSNQLFCSSCLGEQLWSIPVSNYFLEPQILLCSDLGMAYISSGPSQPCLFRINLESEERKSFELPGPSVGLDSRDGEIISYTLPLERGQSSLVWKLGGDGSWRVIEDLEACISRFRRVRDLTFLFATGFVFVRNQQGEEIACLESEGAPFDAYWCASSNRFLVLSQLAGSTVLQSFRKIKAPAELSLEKGKK